MISPFSFNFGIAYGWDDISQVSTELATLKQHFSLVRFYNFDTTVMNAAVNHHFEVILGTEEADVTNFASDQNQATTYVTNNVVPYKDTIKTIIVGNEVYLNFKNQPHWATTVVNAMTHLHRALSSAGLSIPVTTSFSMGATHNSYPPDNTEFIDSTVADIMNYIGQTSGFVFLDVYPFHAVENQPNQLSYALFESSVSVGGKTFPGMFAAQYYGFSVAIGKLGLSEPEPAVYIAETGWASAGDVSATVANEQTYINNYIKYAKKPVYTRLSSIPTLLFEGFDQTTKPSGTEQHYGLYTQNSTSPKFPISGLPD